MAREDGKRKLTAPLAALAKYKYVFLVAALGAVLLLWPTGRQAESGTGPEAAPDSGAAELRQTEEAMEAILGKISGVGRVDVMLTLSGGSELVLAQDGALRYSGSSQAPDNYERTTQTVTDAGGVVVTQEKTPTYRGALVVCEGGDSDAVRLQVIAAVSALTGLGSDRIAVVKWQAAPAGGTANQA